MYFMFIYLPYLLVCLRLFHHTCRSVCLPFCSLASLPVCLPVRLSVVSGWLSVCPKACPSFYLITCVFVCVILSILSPVCRPVVIQDHQGASFSPCGGTSIPSSCPLCLSPFPRSCITNTLPSNSPAVVFLSLKFMGKNYSLKYTFSTVFVLEPPKKNQESNIFLARPFL